MQQFAANDNQTIQLRGFTPSVVDLGGVPLQNTDGSPVTADQVITTWSSDTPGVADVRATDKDGNAIVNGTDVVTPAPGTATISAAMTYPDGSTKVVQYGVTVGFSAPSEPTVIATVVDE